MDGLVCVVFHIGIAQFWNDLRLVDHRSGDGLRRAGVKDAATICMIAAVAYRRALALLAWDADMFRVTKVIGIELDEASLRA